MGLILKPAEIKNCAEQMRSQMESNRNSYAGALQTVQKFTENDSFKSESWDTMKGKVFGSHQVISRGMVAVDDSVLRDFSTMEGIAEGDELDEDLLMKTIMLLKEECIQYETTIQTLLQLQASLPPGTYNSINQYIKKCREMLEKTKEELKLVKEMLNLLYQKTEQTSGLFQTIGTLLGAIECAINDAEVYISGRGTLSDESWKTVIPDMINQINDVTFSTDLEVKCGTTTRDFLKSQEGIWETAVGSNGTYSIGHGCDFTKDSDPELYNKYVVLGEKITEKDADELLEKKLVAYAEKVDEFISNNNLEINQNQYDALVSYFYNNGLYVFSDTVYDKWVDKGGEYKIRAEARKELKEYLIEENGNYDDQQITRLFVASKGPNIKYEYVGRRTKEANLFIGKE